MRVGWFVCVAVIAFALFAGSGGALIARTLGAAGVVAPVWLTGPIMVLAGAIAYWCGGISFGRPVGLRLDRDGLSGFLLPATLWSQVADVGLHEVLRFEDGSRAAQDDLYFALRLYDQEGWWLQATLVQKFCGLRRGGKSRWDVLLPLNALEAADQKALIDLAIDQFERR